MTPQEMMDALKKIRDIIRGYDTEDKKCNDIQDVLDMECTFDDED